MVAVEPQNPAAIPTPETEEQCRDLVHQWSTGNIPFREVIDRLALLAQAAQARGWQADLARIEHLLGYVQHDRGNLNTSIMHFERSRSMYESVGNWPRWPRIAMIDLNLGEAYRYKGDFMRARYLYRKAYDAATKLDLIETKTLAVVNEGLMLVNMGRFEQALNALVEGYQLAQQWQKDSDQNLPAMLCELHYGLAVIYINQDRPELAWQHARQSLEAARLSQQPIQIAIAYRVIGDALTRVAAAPFASAEGFSTEPDEHYQSAMKSLRELHADAELAHTLFSHGKSLASRGRRLNAARQLQQAMIIYTRLDMIADAANAAKAQLEITA